MSIGMAEIVSVMELATHNRIVSFLKCKDDARGEADDAHLHTNSDDDGTDTIRRKHNDGNFYDNDGDGDDKEEEEDDNDDNDDKKTSETQ